ncbi:zinc knuckle CX2CX4HX4C [Artemisia annua]|uniref:Zinc knuckle CX2CX4HX4C n=1 Tax=Artemisia annua TaxID=35608 RepID=A0A2U1M3R8_ARTAN|nr:zinc knuckle CX2CX4HX4C [Artemisia annua]
MDRMTASICEKPYGRATFARVLVEIASEIPLVGFVELCRIVSQIGSPIMMDRMTASICEKPYGRATFARVLVEIDSEIPLVGFVELWYESLGKVLRLRVEHDWVPPRCEECKVFGHYLSDCQNKVNVARKVNKDGKNVKPSEVKNGNNGTVSGNVNVDEVWTTAGNRRNRGGGNNLRQGNFGGYQTRKGVYVNTASGNNTSNVNTGNKGNKEVSKKLEPVKSGNIGSVDDSVVMNDKGVPANKGKGKVDEGISGGDGNRNSGNNDNKKNEQKKNLGNKSSNKNGNVSKSGDGRNPKDVLGSKNVSTSNRFDALGSVVKGWNEDMIKYYTEKLNSRIMMNGSPEQQLELKLKSLSNRIILLNRNISINAKMNAQKMMQKSVLTSHDSNDVSLSKCYDEAYRVEQFSGRKSPKEILQGWFRKLMEASLFIFLFVGIRGFSKLVRGFEGRVEVELSCVSSNVLWILSFVAAAFLGLFTLGLLHGALVLAVFDYRGVPIHGILTLLAVWKGIMA